MQTDSKMQVERDAERLEIDARLAHNAGNAHERDDYLGRAAGLWALAGRTGRAAWCDRFKGLPVGRPARTETDDVAVELALD
jgi:hypothetical protein